MGGDGWRSNVPRCCRSGCCQAVAGQRCCRRWRGSRRRGASVEQTSAEVVCQHESCRVPPTNTTTQTSGYYRTRRKARCSIGADRNISPGRWVRHKQAACEIGSRDGCVGARSPRTSARGEQPALRWLALLRALLPILTSRPPRARSAKVTTCHLVDRERCSRRRMWLPGTTVLEPTANTNRAS